MNVVILAAGKGSRLGNEQLPKPLTRLLNGKSILQLQLENIAKFLPLEQVNIVVGFHKEAIIREFPALKYIENSNFSNENTSKSLLKALLKVKGDVLWLNGDVVFHPSALEKILKANNTAVLVNTGLVEEEAVKYRSDGSEHILEISKEVTQPEGEALGINLFKEADVGALIRNLEKCKDQDYFEKAIEACITEGISIQKVSIDSNLCIEIDFPEDLKKANTLITSWI